MPSPIRTKILQSIWSGLASGENKIRESLRRGDVTLSDIANAIKGQKCLDVGDREVGSMYLEQIVSRVVNDSTSVPVKYLNPIRQKFGLETLSDKELRKMVSKRAKTSRASQEAS